MILLLGASGYIGRAFASELRQRGRSFIPLTRQAFDYSRFDFLFDYVRTIKPSFLINAAGLPGHLASGPSSAGREAMMAANAILPQTVARVCIMTKTPWGHVSSGDVYAGAGIFSHGTGWARSIPGKGGRINLIDTLSEPSRGFTECDEPNSSFRDAQASFYSATKALGEESIRGIGETYIWRPRLFFDEGEERGNYLFRLQGQAGAPDEENSLSHRGDFVKAALDLWEAGAPYGIYNMTNPGVVTSRRLAEAVRRALGVEAGAARNQDAARSDNDNTHCALDVSKLLRTGTKMRPLEDAVRESIDRMRTAAGPKRAAKPAMVSADIRPAALPA